MNGVDKSFQENKRHQRIHIEQRRNCNSSWRTAKQKQQRSASLRLKHAEYGESTGSDAQI